jgi:peptidoglycan/LPS O-acetylase OafA/YrhL
MSKSNNNIEPLQMLRGLAAIAVVVHHTIRALMINNQDIELASPWIIDNHTLMEVGSAGVDIFFYSKWIFNDLYIKVISEPFKSSNNIFYK